MLLSRALPVAVLVGLVGTNAFIAGPTNADTVKGKRVFDMQCAGCHSMEAGTHRAGPSLYRVLGQPAGSASGFDYSPAMRDADIVWTPDVLDAFLQSPEQVVPGTRMVFWGLNEAEREQVIQYLKHAGE